MTLCKHDSSDLKGAQLYKYAVFLCCVNFDQREMRMPFSRMFLLNLITCECKITSGIRWHWRWELKAQKKNGRVGPQRLCGPHSAEGLG